MIYYLFFYLCYGADVKCEYTPNVDVAHFFTFHIYIARKLIVNMICV